MYRNKKLITFLLVLILGLSLNGCMSNKENTSTNEDVQVEVASDSASEDEITLTDMTGREVTIKRPIEKIIVNQWDLGEVISMVVGAEYEDMLKAVGGSGSADNFQRVYGNAMPKLENMTTISGGGQKGYDLETIIKIQPNVFFVNSRGSFLQDRMKDIEDLEKAGIPVFILTLGEDAINSPMEGISILGKIFDKEERAKEINDFIQSQFDLVDENLKDVNDEDRVSIYYEHSNKATKTTYANTNVEGGWATIIEKAKGKNIATGFLTENVAIDPEYLLKTNPDTIMFSTSLGYVDEQSSRAPKLINEVIQRTGWDTLDAVKNKRVYALFHDHSRTPFAFYPTLYLAKQFYPEQMKDVNPDDILKEFYDRFMLVECDDGVWSYKLN